VIHATADDAGTEQRAGRLAGLHTACSGAYRTTGVYSMLDHVSIRVANYDRSKAFYEAALAPLGYTLAMEVASGAGFGRSFKPDFWIKQGEPMSLASAETHELAGCGGASIHVAFVSDDHSMVDAFYRAALAAGGQDNGAPGLRPEYHPNYYGAFVLDPDGYNIEAVCHRAM
jgi:catechol 2,3-dioxygenase-like lactoylglutathione lyase family enzyme